MCRDDDAGRARPVRAADEGAEIARIRHLVENDRVRTIGNVRIDFDSAVHRTRMQDRDFLRRAVEPLARNAEYAIVLAQRRDVAGLHSFELESEDVERVGPFDRGLDAIEHGDAHAFDGVG